MEISIGVISSLSSCTNEHTGTVWVWLVMVIAVQTGAFWVFLQCRYRGRGTFSGALGLGQGGLHPCVAAGRHSALYHPAPPRGTADQQQFGQVALCSCRVESCICPLMQDVSGVGGALSDFCWRQSFPVGNSSH